MHIQIDEDNKLLYETILKVCRDKLSVIDQGTGRNPTSSHETFKTTDNYVLTFHIDKDKDIIKEVEIERSQ